MSNTVTLGGNAVQVEGDLPQKGQTAPAFTLLPRISPTPRWPALPASARC